MFGLEDQSGHFINLHPAKTQRGGFDSVERFPCTNIMSSGGFMGGGEGGGRRPCREEQENKFKNRQKLAQICARTMQKPSKSVQFFS
jgi:hypothetical protein